MRKIKATAILIFSFFALFISTTNSAFGYPPFLKEAQQLGLGAKDCTFCHQSPKGGKGWNKRGLWLKDQKKERKAPMVDVKWLKDYTDDAEKPKEGADKN